MEKRLGKNPYSHYSQTYTKNNNLAVVGGFALIPIRSNPLADFSTTKYIFYHICCTFPDGRLNYLDQIDNSKRMLCATIQRKRPKKTIEKFDKINEILSEFDNLQPDLQISSLSSTLERLGSL